MSSTLSPTRSNSADRWRTEQSVDAMAHPVDFDRLWSSRKRPLGRRVSSALARFLTTFCFGVGATLAWQSYGDEARGMIAVSSPQLAWLAPQASLPQTVPDVVAPTAPVVLSPNLEQFNALSLSLAAMRQRMDQLAIGQQRMAGDIAKLQADEQDMVQKISTPPPRPAAAAVRKPVPPTQSLSQAPAVR
jgi:hypothetical protein